MALLSTIISVLLMGILVLVAIVIIRTVAFKSKQVLVKEKISYPVEADKAAARLAEAIRFKTVSNADRSLVDYSTFRDLHGSCKNPSPWSIRSWRKKSSMNMASCSSGKVAILERSRCC